MKALLYVIIGILLFSCTSKKENFGKLIINESFDPFYENDDIYFSFDYFVEANLQSWNGWLDTVLFLRKTNENLIITNQFNDGLAGLRVIFTISKNLDITNVEYMSWMDVFNGGESSYTVEKVIFYVSDNPFECSQITGYYTLQIRYDIFIADKIKYGDHDTTVFHVSHGKFKVYSEEEKANGRDWVISQNDILLGIKDSSEVYYSPDKYAEYALGGDTLDELLKHFEINRSKTTLEKRKFVDLCMVIDENGKVVPESMTLENMKSDELLREIKNCKPLLHNWKPAIYKDKTVKSKMNLPIKIKD